MSAAKAKRPGSIKPQRGKEASGASAFATGRQVVRRTGIQHDVVVDGKVVKSAYNAGVRERFVHVTEMIYDVYGKYVDGVEKDAGRIKEHFGNGFFNL
jgi:hypothetical protein